MFLGAPPQVVFILHPDADCGLSAVSFCEPAQQTGRKNISLRMIPAKAFYERMQVQPDANFELVAKGIFACREETERQIILDHVIDTAEGPRIEGERLGHRTDLGVLVQRSEIQVSRLPHSQTALSCFQL